MSFKVTTRARERGAGERDDLWDVIVNNDDICFEHILPRLNPSDVKFLNDVNTETRALIKRSNRVEELTWPFNVQEMSSISTLELAWENMRWGTKGSIEEEMDQAYFCAQVAATNKLELLKWVREEKNCDWNANITNHAALNGDLEMMKYCVANGCPVCMHACASAAQDGHLEMLKYIYEEVKVQWDWATAICAAENGHLPILKYLFERKYDAYDGMACQQASKNGHLDCLKYLHETAKAPWDGGAVREAHKRNRSDCLQYLLDNDCPLPEGWRYEHGELYARSPLSEANLSDSDS